MKNMQSVKDILLNRQMDDSGRFITHEFQDYGYRLAEELDDLPHKGLYMKLAKREDRALLEGARCYVADYPKAKNRGRLFMWKLGQLKNEQKSVSKNLRRG